MKQPPAEIIVLLADDILDDRECDPLLWIPGLEHDYMPEFCTSYTRTDIVDRLRAEIAAKDPTPALGWKAAREAAAGICDRRHYSFTASSGRDPAKYQSANSMSRDEIRALPAPTSAQLLAEAMRLPEVAALVDRLAEFAARLADPDTRPNCTCRGCRPRSPQGGQPMSDIDISREMVENLCHIHRGYEQHGTVAMLLSLRAALDAAEAAKRQAVLDERVQAARNLEARAELFEDANDLAYPHELGVKTALIIAAKHMRKIAAAIRNQGEPK